MKLTVIGCSGSYPGPESAASCYLVEHDGFSMVLDMGNGSLGSLQRYTDVFDIDAVLLSHLHADHCFDLCSYYVARKYRPEGPAPRIPVFGPAATATRMASAYDLPLNPGMTNEFDFRPHVQRHELGPFTVTTRRVDHPVESYGFRIEADGAALVYSGDTGPCPDLRELAMGADVALFEASCAPGASAPGLHMTGAEAGRVASEAGVSSLLITHLVPWNDNDLVFDDAQAHFDGPVTPAQTGLVVGLANQ